LYKFTEIQDRGLPGNLRNHYNVKNNLIFMDRYNNFSNKTKFFYLKQVIYMYATTMRHLNFVE